MRDDIEVYRAGVPVTKGVVFCMYEVDVALAWFSSS